MILRKLFACRKLKKVHEFSINSLHILINETIYAPLTALPAILPPTSIVFDESQFNAPNARNLQSRPPLSLYRHSFSENPFLLPPSHAQLAYSWPHSIHSNPALKDF